MASVMRQEVGGNPSKYLNNPETYHYPMNEKGKRIAPHTGKVSTAFGPFGILESTARDPGYGVSPLKGKDLQEQIRFASDYLAARSKDSGGLVAGLAGYGEGSKYASQVASRIGAPVTPDPMRPWERPDGGAVVLSGADAPDVGSVALASGGATGPAALPKEVVKQLLSAGGESQALNQSAGPWQDFMAQMAKAHRASAATTMDWVEQLQQREQSLRQAGLPVAPVSRTVDFRAWKPRRVDLA